MELWELSDGRVWQLESQEDKIKVLNLDFGYTSPLRVGFFDSPQEVEKFAMNYLGLEIVMVVS